MNNVQHFISLHRSNNFRDIKAAWNTLSEPMRIGLLTGRVYKKQTLEALVRRGLVHGYKQTNPYGTETWWAVEFTSRCDAFIRTVRDYVV